MFLTTITTRDTLVVIVTIVLTVIRSLINLSKIDAYKRLECFFASSAFTWAHIKAEEDFIRIKLTQVIIIEIHRIHVSIYNTA